MIFLLVHARLRKPRESPSPDPSVLTWLMSRSFKISLLWKWLWTTYTFLWVADVLIDLLLLELKCLDRIEKATSVKSLEQLQYIRKYESTLKTLGISGFSFWIGWESKKLKCRTLTGPEKLIVFEKLNIIATFPEIPDCEDVQTLWCDLLEVNRMLSVWQEDLTAEHVKKTLNQSQKHLSTSLRKCIVASM